MCFVSSLFLKISKMGPLPVQLAAEMSLPRVACVAFLLILTMNLPLAQSRRCMNPTTTHGRTSNRKPFRQSNSAAKMILPCLACLHEILWSSGRRSLGIDLLLM
jgi:hypothetical protein